VTWGWVFIAEAVLFVAVVGGLGVGLLGRLKRLRGEVVRLQGAVPATAVQAQFARLAAARSGRPPPS